MALFTRSKSKKADAPKKAEKAPKAKVAKEVNVAAGKFAHVLMNPRITEKATMATTQSVYVFDVDTSTNKKEVASAIEAIYKVKPRKIAIINVRSKAIRNMRTGKYGVKSGGKKAYVYLNKGESITVA